MQFSTATSAAWYLGVNKPRKEAYKNFYATYDADADFERMKVNVLPNLTCKLNFMHSIPGLRNLPISGYH